VPPELSEPKDLLANKVQLAPKDLLVLKVQPEIVDLKDLPVRRELPVTTVGPLS
jgi:hypothetical protein